MKVLNYFNASSELYNVRMVLVILRVYRSILLYCHTIRTAATKCETREQHR